MSTVVGVILVVAFLLIPKGFLLNLASKAGVKVNKSNGKSRSWFGQELPDKQTSTTEKPQPTFVECHLEGLRAWHKPTDMAQLPLPPYPAKPDAVHQSRGPAGMSYQGWQERQRNATMRLNPMHEFKLTGAGVKGPAYWKKITEEMKARKSWWEKAKDKLRM